MNATTVAVDLAKSVFQLAVAANKLARICYATLRDKERFDEKQPLIKKMNRQVFAFPG